MISYIAGLTNQMISYIVTFLIAYKNKNFNNIGSIYVAIIM